MLDVCVAGGGIGGAVLALEMARRGREVCILEREAAPVPVVRPEILWEPTMAELDRRVPDGRLRRDAAVSPSGLRIESRGERLFGFGEEEFAAAETRPWSTDAGATRRLLIEAALSTGRVRLIRGAEVTGVLREGGRIAGLKARVGSAEQEFPCRLTVGDDGVRSVVRREMGQELKTRFFPLEFVTAALAEPPEGGPPLVRGWADLRKLSRGVFALAIFPLPAGKAVLLLPLKEKVWDRRYASDEAAFWEDVGTLTPVASWLRERLRFPADFHRIRRPYGHAARYVADGAAILGDAAHPMSPAGGQGANAAIWDALALAEAADAGDLRGYEGRRRPANDRSLFFTRRGATLLGLSRWVPGMATLMERRIRSADRSPETKVGLLRAVSSAFQA